MNMLADNTVLNVKDFGTGNSGQRKVKDIARRSSTDVRYGGVMQKIIDAFKVESILELGTSVGIGTMFLARTNAKTEVTTVEGCPETYEFAKSEFAKRKITNVNFVNDDFDHLFARNALKDKHFDLAFIDGNHTSEATIRYFDNIIKRYSNKKSIIIVDDINWSRDMYDAWKEISSRMPDSLRINLFRMGIIFTGYDFPKEELIAEIFKVV